MNVQNVILHILEHLIQQLMNAPAMKVIEIRTL